MRLHENKQLFADAINAASSQHTPRRCAAYYLSTQNEKIDVTR